jgi:hypothetical protein
LDIANDIITINLICELSRRSRALLFELPT